MHFERDDETVGSVYNDDGIRRTMARLEAAGEDFIGVEVPKPFVADLLAAAEEHGRIPAYGLGAAEGSDTPVAGDD